MHILVTCVCDTSLCRILAASILAIVFCLTFSHPLQNFTTALIRAATNGHADCMQVLLDAGADTEAQGRVRVRVSLSKARWHLVLPLLVLSMFLSLICCAYCDFLIGLILATCNGTISNAGFLHSSDACYRRRPRRLRSHSLELRRQHWRRPGVLLVC